MKLIGFVLVGAGLLLPALSGQDKAVMEKEPEPLSPKAVLYRLEGELTRTMITSLDRARRTAKRTGASILIIEIDTPGGESGLMEEIRDLIFEAEQEDDLETVAYIDPNADSAGALIAMACRRLYMSRLGHIGSATPVAINPINPLGSSPMAIDEDMERKIMARFLAVFRATARERGRNVYVAEAMVDPDIELVLARINGEEQIMTREKFMDERESLGESRAVEIDVICQKGELLNITSQEALDIGFIDGIPESKNDLFTGYLGVSKEEVVVIQRTWSEGLVDFLESIHWLLLVAGLVFLYIEFKVPGFGVPGIIGISCLAVLLLGKWLTGLAEIPEIIMIVLGLGLIALEIFVVPGTFIAGAAGALLVLAGILLSFQPFVLPESPWDVELLEMNIVSLGLSMLAFAATAVILTRFLPKTPLFQKLVLSTGKLPGELHASAGAFDDVHEISAVVPGDRGKAASDLHPSGKILIDNTTLDAQSEGEYIDNNDPVRVVRVMGNFIFVRKDKENHS